MNRIRLNPHMLKNLLPVVAIAAFSVSSHAGAVKAEPVTQQETVELKAEASTKESEKAENQEGGLLGIPSGLITLAAAAAVIYYATKD